MGRRRTVRCWFCGHVARRVPNARGLNPDFLDEDGRVKVVLRKRTVVPFGVCGAKTAYWPSGCPEPMLLPEDAAFVCRAAVQYDRGGGNKRSEFDL